MYYKCLACDFIAKIYKFLKKHVIKCAIIQNTKWKKIIKKIYINRDKIKRCIKNFDNEKIENEEYEKYNSLYEKNNDILNTTTEWNIFINDLINVINLCNINYISLQWLIKSQKRSNKILNN